MSTRRRCFAIQAAVATAAVIALAAPAARAEETPPGDPAAHPMATTSTGGSLLNVSSAPFGDTGQMVYSLTSDGDFPFRYSKTGGGSWNFILRPALDYFIKQSVSVGGMLRIETGGGTSVVGFGLRAGYDVALSSLVSLWVRGGLSYAHTSVSNGPSRSVTALDILIPFLFHLVPHLFIGVGPFFSLPLTDSRAMANKDPSYGLTAIVGGYF